MRVIVTGASRGIGRGIAVVLAREGFQIGLVARAQEKLEETAGLVRKAGGEPHIAACDLTDPDAVDRSFDTLFDAMGGIDALINNAGVVIRKSVYEISVTEWQSMVNTNLNGLFYATRAVLTRMRAQQSGHIINVSSISGKVPLAGGSGYAATKFAVNGFSQSLREEIRDDGIKVTTIFPGSVDSGRS
ncbi:MAG: SDR family NAD(P)-dependent oxidoreductase, partial [Candidatus Hydrogenedentota bacterium]